MRFIRLFCLVWILLMLGGCFDYNELNMQEIVNGVGIDAVEGGVRVTVVCAPTGGIDDKEGAKYTAEGGSFFEAVRELGSRADKKLYWGHASCILIGEDATRYTDEILDTVLRVQDLYLDIAPVVVHGASAKELIDTAPPGGSDVFESISDMFANEENSRRFFSKRAWQIFREREADGEYILPTASIEDGKMLLEGGAVMKNGEIAGFLDGEQMLALSLMTKSGAGGYLPTLTLLQGGSASFEILANDIKKKESADGAKIHIKCVLSPAGVQGKVDSKVMEDSAKEYLEKSFSGLIVYARENGMEDIFGTNGKTPEVTCEVTVSNILGGKK